jgi:MFS family permease
MHFSCKNVASVHNFAIFGDDILHIIAICIIIVANYCTMEANVVKKTGPIIKLGQPIIEKKSRETSDIINHTDLARRALNRRSVRVFFLMHGLCFATWASRIPTIQSNLHLSAATLGTILFALPLGFFVSLAFAGWLVGKVGSKKTVILSSILYSLSLVSIGWSGSAVQVAFSLLSFGFFANLLNISMNTQAVAVEELYNKRMMATFHGLWSLAGFVGAAVGGWMIGKEIAPVQHFVFISSAFLIATAIFASRLIEKDKNKGEKIPLLALPDKALLGLGLIAFCSMMVEGAMFDWSGIYFTEVVVAPNELTGLGYTTFMIAMAGMRFLADNLAERFGLKRILQASGLLATAGLVLAVIFPQLLTSVLGFLLVGIGVSSVVPMIYSAAGKSKTMAAGTALTAVSSLGFMGFLIGPPTIGFIAEVSSLKGSFLALTAMSIAVFVFSSFLNRDKV